MSDTLNENWLPIAGYEWLYSVSDLGRIRSERRVIARNGSPYTLPERILKPSNDGKGYFRVNLSVGSKVRTIYIHQAVARAFIGPQQPGNDVCHTDGNPANNRLSNLRYDSRASNINDSKRHRTFSEAEIHPVAILSNADAIAIYNATGVSAADLGKRYGVSAAVINQIWRGDTWKSVTGGKPVTSERGVRTYLRTILSKSQADFALANRSNRTGRKDGRGIKPTAVALGVDADTIKALYAAADSGKNIFFAE